MSIFIGDTAPHDFFVDGNKIPMTIGRASITDLHFWVDNPRVYDEVHGLGISPEEISTDDIYQKLSNYPDAVSLTKKIVDDGGIRDHIIVAQDKKTKKYIVYEGNTRLSVAIKLFKNGEPGEWSIIPIKLLDMSGFDDDELIVTYIGDIHLQDEKNKWLTHKGARYYWRMVKDKLAKGVPTSKACDEVANKFSKKITKGVVEKNFNIIEFMENRNMGVIKQGKQFSYWIEYFTNKNNQAVRDYFNNIKNLDGKVDEPKEDAFDTMMVNKVTNGRLTGEVERVSASGDHSFRSDIKNIANHFDKQPKKAKEIIFKLLNGEIKLQEAVRRSVEGGANDQDYKMVQDFHRQIMNSDIKKLRAAVKKYDDILPMISDIQSHLTLTHADLKKEYDKIKNRKKI